MAHYRCIQVSTKKLTKDEIENYSVDIDMIDDKADYINDVDCGDALEELEYIFGKSIVRRNKCSITISKERLKQMLVDKYDAWKNDVMNMSLDEALKHGYEVFYPARHLSCGDLLHDEAYCGVPEDTWDFLTMLYRHRFAEGKDTLTLYYGASVDFHR